MSEKLNAFISSVLKELEDDRPRFKRFGEVIELQKEVCAALSGILKVQIGIAPSSDENQIALQTIDNPSTTRGKPTRRILNLDESTDPLDLPRHPIASDDLPTDRRTQPMSKRSRIVRPLPEIVKSSVGTSNRDY